MLAATFGLGQLTYAYIDGRCKGWLPRGDVLVDVREATSTSRCASNSTLHCPGQQRLELRLWRWTDMNARRCFSGDTHVTFSPRRAAAGALVGAGAAAGPHAASTDVAIAPTASALTCRRSTRRLLRWLSGAPFTNASFLSQLAQRDSASRSISAHACPGFKPRGTYIVG